MVFVINDFFFCNLIENDIFLEIYIVLYRNIELIECDLFVIDIVD